MRTCCPISANMERWEGGADAYRGGDGPLAVQTCRYQDPLIDAFAEAGRTAGHAVDRRLQRRRNSSAFHACR